MRIKVMVKRLTDLEIDLLFKERGLDMNGNFTDIFYMNRNKTEKDKVYTMLFEAECVILKSALNDPVFCNYFKDSHNNVGTTDSSVFSGFDSEDFQRVLMNFKDRFSSYSNYLVSDYHLYDSNHNSIREYVCNYKFRENGLRGSLKTTNQMLDKLYQYKPLFNSSCGFHTHVSVNSLNAYSKFMTLSFKKYFNDWYDYFSISNNVQNEDNYKRIKGDHRFCVGTFNPLTENSNYGGSFLQTDKSYSFDGRYEYIQCGYNLQGGSHFDPREIGKKRKTIEFRVFAPFKDLVMAKNRMRSLNKMLNSFLAYYKDIPANEIDTSEKRYISKNENFYYNGFELGLRQYNTNDPIKMPRGSTIRDFQNNYANGDLQDYFYELNENLKENGFKLVRDLDL